MKGFTKELYQRLISKENGVENKIALKLAHLADYIQTGKINPILKKEFIKLNILTSDGKLQMDNPQDMLEWNLLGMVIDGKLERSLSK